MRAFKLAVQTVAIIVVLPAIIVGVLGFLFSPLQPTARATEPRDVMEANDLMLSEAVKEQVSQSGEAESQEEAVEVAVECEESPDEATEREVSSSEALEVEDPSDEVSEPDGSLEEIAGWTYQPEGAIEGESDADRHTSSELRTQGVIDDGDCRYMWYSQRVLPGGGLDIEGRHTSEDGYVVDAQNRIVVASSDLPYGAEIDIPFGDGKAIVLDTGCAPGVLDIYTDF